MIRQLAAAALLAGFMGTAAMAQSARAPDPDPIALPDDEPNTVVVPGSIQRPVQLPNGDVRSARERARDRSRFDRCVMKIQNRHSDDQGSANPVDVSPEDYCASHLGMRDRNSAPAKNGRGQ